MQTKSFESEAIHLESLNSDVQFVVKWKATKEFEPAIGEEVFRSGYWLIKDFGPEGLQTYYDLPSVNHIWFLTRRSVNWAGHPEYAGILRNLPEVTTAKAPEFQTYGRVA